MPLRKVSAGVVDAQQRFARPQRRVALHALGQSPLPLGSQTLEGITQTIVTPIALAIVWGVLPEFARFDSIRVAGNS
jgi:hypothetical protein